jgi:nicotinate-nucleotide pyrophosphorylase (carboxylating)
MNFDRLLLKAARKAVALALMEDMGRAGDITSQLTVPEDARAVGVYEFKEPAVICGVRLVVAVCRKVSSDISIDILKGDGEPAAPGDVAVRVEGPARAILAAERTSLNFFTHLSGIATLTRKYVDAVAGTEAQIFDTRKTIPGLRLLEKYAVRCGGGVNHRIGLYDQVLVKDNHIAIMCARCGEEGLEAELARVRRETPEDVLVEVEATSLREVKAATRAGADIVMLDNMTLEAIGQAVEFVKSRGGRPPILEASGGVTLANVAEVARTGVDRISVGALTHSAPAVDISLEIT